MTSSRSAGAAGVDREALGAVLGEVAAGEDLAHALDVRLERLQLLVVEPARGLVRLVGGLGQHGGGLRGARRGGGELAGIEVEEDREDEASLGVDLGEPAQAPARDRVGGHVVAATPRTRGEEPSPVTTLTRG